MHRCILFYSLAYCGFRLPTPAFLGFPGGSASKESACNVGDLGLIPELGRSPGEGKDSPHQYSGLENSMDCIVHGVAKSRTRLSDFHFHFLPWFITGYGIQFPVPYRQTLLFIHPIYNSVSANPKLLISPLLPPFQLQACFPRLFLSLMKSFVSCF